MESVALTSSGAPARCRACNHTPLDEVLSLGKTPLANRLLSEEELSHDERRYPLDLAFCSACSLVQITETVPPGELFSDYVYFSSVSETVVENARDNVAKVVARKPLGAADLVVELASNDGYLLQHYVERGIPVLGIEPATNIAAVARERGIETLNEFFTLELAQERRESGRTASVMHASNVLAHVPDLNGFVAGIATLLRPDGFAVIEVPYVVDMVEGGEFDTIYHEHLCYFSATALSHLFARHDLALLDVERLPIHGGSLRVVAGRGAAGESVARILEEERAWGVTSVDRYLEMRATVERSRTELLEMLRSLRAGGARIAAYGASAKGATLLNYFGIGSDILEYVVDRSSVKQGRFTPGTHLLIRSPEVLTDDRPDYLLLLTWNHADEILRQQQAYRDGGGKFIIPVPRLTVV
jgi:SAM-dependent methyltransferase